MTVNDRDRPSFSTVRPDYSIEVRREILEENDGPMLLHGLKEMHGQKIILPKKYEHRPRQALLERRYERFRSEWERSSGM